ncbi:MAG: hypothetical protein HRU36_02670 [Rickettsiales bacterium]|nr:hypothetical protein [Rickettsiales bacterium]
MTFTNLIALHIIIPIFGALLNVLSRNNLKLANIITCCVLVSLCAASLSTLLLVFQINEYSYSFGGWSAPFGIEFKINYYGELFITLISVAALCCFLYGKDLIKTEIEHARIPIFYALFLICIFGLYGIIMTNDFFSFYVFIEINSLATYTLVSWNSTNRNSLIAAFYYLIIGGVAASFFLIGVGYLYSASGTLNISHFLNKFQSIKYLKTVHLGVCLIAVGLLIKSALFPLHNWVLKIYKETNKFILPFLGASSNKIYLFIFAKLFYLGLFNLSIIRYLLLPAGVIAMLACAIRAVYSTNIRTILALSGLVQVGYVFILMGLEYKFSFLLIALQLLSYCITALTLFMLTVSFGEIRSGYSLDNLGNLIHEKPFYVILFIINSLSLIGFPLTIRFLPKFALFIDLIHNKSWFAFIAVTCASILTFIYLAKIINALVFNTKPPIELSFRKTTFIETAIVSSLTSANIIIGILSLFFLNIFVR